MEADEFVGWDVALVLLHLYPAHINRLHGCLGKANVVLGMVLTSPSGGFRSGTWMEMRNVGKRWSSIVSL